MIWFFRDFKKIGYVVLNKNKLIFIYEIYSYLTR